VHAEMTRRLDLEAAEPELEHTRPQRHDDPGGAALGWSFAIDGDCDPLAFLGQSLHNRPRDGLRPSPRTS
jgi:hypothetical protein